MGRKRIELVDGKTVFKVEFLITRPNGKYNIKPLRINGEACGNLGMVNKPRKPKIYVLIKGNRIIYVGGTRSGLRSRLYAGLNHDKYPYEWRGLPGRLTLVVFVLRKEYDNQVKKGRFPKGIEAFEGELCFLVRCSGRWPDYQTEIHFHSTKVITRDNARDMAQYLIDKGLAENIEIDRYS